MFGFSQVEKATGTCIQDGFPVPRRFSLSTASLVFSGIFSPAPTASQPAGAHLQEVEGNVVTHRQQPEQCYRLGQRQEGHSTVRMALDHILLPSFICCHMLQCQAGSVKRHTNGSGGGDAGWGVAEIDYLCCFKEQRLGVHRFSTMIFFFGIS